MTNIPFNPASGRQGTQNRYTIVVDYNGLLVSDDETIRDNPRQMKLRGALVEAAQYGHKIIFASEFRDERVHREFLTMKMREISPKVENPAALFMNNNSVVTLYSEIQEDPVAALGVKAANIYIGPRSHEDDVPHAQAGEITRPDISQRLRFVLNMPQLPEDAGYTPPAP